MAGLETATRSSVTDQLIATGDTCSKGEGSRWSAWRWRATSLLTASRTSPAP